MYSSIKNLELKLEIDDSIIYEFSGKINEESMIESAKHIEKLLKLNNAKAGKIKSVFELMVEIMQNILNNSYKNIDIGINKKEAKGSFTLIYNTINDIYTLKSCNLIQSHQKSIIEKKLQTLKGLDKSQLRKLALEKMRSREDNHKKGAGLGFIMMAKKSIKPIEVEFVSHKNDILAYHLEVVV